MCETSIERIELVYGELKWSVTGRDNYSLSILPVTDHFNAVTVTIDKYLG